MQYYTISTSIAIKKAMFSENIALKFIDKI